MMIQAMGFRMLFSARIMNLNPIVNQSACQAKVTEKTDWMRDCQKRGCQGVVTEKMVKALDILSYFYSLTIILQDAELEVG